MKPDEVLQLKKLYSRTAGENTGSNAVVALCDEVIRLRAAMQEAVRRMGGDAARPACVPAVTHLQATLDA